MGWNGGSYRSRVIWVSDKIRSIRYDQSSIERVVGLPPLQNCKTDRDPPYFRMSLCHVPKFVRNSFHPTYLFVRAIDRAIVINAIKWGWNRAPINGYLNRLTNKWMGFVGVITQPYKLELFQPCLLLVTEPAHVSAGILPLGWYPLAV